MIAALPDAREAPGSSVRVDAREETGADCPATDNSLPIRGTWGLEGLVSDNMTGRNSVRRSADAQYAPVQPVPRQVTLAGSMALSDTSLDEFIAVYAEEYGEHLSREVARPIATNLVNFFRLISRPLPDEVPDPARTDPATSESNGA